VLLKSKPKGILPERIRWLEVLIDYPIDRELPALCRNLFDSLLRYLFLNCLSAKYFLNMRWKIQYFTP